MTKTKPTAVPTHMYFCPLCMFQSLCLEATRKHMREKHPPAHQKAGPYR